MWKKVPFVLELSTEPSKDNMATMLESTVFVSEMRTCNACNMTVRSQCVDTLSIRYCWMHGSVADVVMACLTVTVWVHVSVPS